MARGEFSRFLGSISGQTSIFGVKYLRDPQITPPPQGVPPPTTRDFCLVVGGGAPLNGGWRPLLWGPLTILPQNFVLGALFGPNEVLETQVVPFLDQIFPPIHINWMGAIIFSGTIPPNIFLIKASEFSGEQTDPPSLLGSTCGHCLSVGRQVPLISS